MQELFHDLDLVGPWSEIKLAIIKDYAVAYSTILSNQSGFQHFYIDAFAGAGIHLAKEDQRVIPGSPLNALEVEPPFREYHFIDINASRTSGLEVLTAGRGNVRIYTGDCNQVLLEEVFPSVRYDEYKRALCMLDPYGMQLDWRVLEAAGQNGLIEVFLNFPISDMNRNVLRKDRSTVDHSQIERMNRFWGDQSWEDVAYKESAQASLFGEYTEEKVSNQELATAFRKRLKEVARFDYVPDPLPMKNSKGSDLYYLYFASNNNTGRRIVRDIFNRYRSMK